jgi:predicted nucleic acid-binding protein
MTLVDANILIDLFTDDPEWSNWSEAQLIEQSRYGLIGINPIIYAEASIAYRTEEAYEAALDPLGLTRWAMPYSAGFNAGKAFLRYRRSGGERTLPLPDFYIGAHAAVSQLRILTRDARRFRRYFPKVELITP